jgi:hypothetical protein
MNYICGGVEGQGCRRKNLAGFRSGPDGGSQQIERFEGFEEFKEFEEFELLRNGGGHILHRRSRGGGL